MAETLVTRINRLALLLALVLFVGLGAMWWRERTRHYETPRWPDASLARLVAPGPGAPARRWIVAVNPECPHCTARLAELRRDGAADHDGAALGVLLVDVPRRPDSLVVGAGLAAGVWWDSAGAWRRRWGRRVYGETLVFGPDGTLDRVLSPTEDLAPPAR
ncbi:MAG: hypothetical protein IT347_04950 [Candidatus Eisenbacteria bacterium]|nr:hypothetical protein [Candidatus Eisenbacteria bacterium]